MNPALTPEKYNEVTDKQLEWLLMFETATVDHPLLDQLRGIIDGDGSKEAMDFLYSDPNIPGLFKCVQWAEEFDKEEKYKKSFINLLKLIVVLYATNGWARSRIGWFIWAMVCCANPNSHFPLTFEGNFEPAKWYYAGEVQRKDDYRINSESTGGFTIPPE